MYALLSDTFLKLYYVQVPDLLKFNCEVQTRNTIYSKAKVLYNMNKPFCDEISQTYEAIVAGEWTHNIVWIDRVIEHNLKYAAN